MFEQRENDNTRHFLLMDCFSPAGFAMTLYSLSSRTYVRGLRMNNEISHERVLYE